MFHQFFFHPLGIRPRLIDLVDGDDDWNLSCLRVMNRLNSLRHDAVVGGDHEDRDVRDLRAAGTHRRERLMSRGVEKYDLFAFAVYLIRADSLRNSARFVC